MGEAKRRKAAGLAPRGLRDPLGAGSLGLDVGTGDAVPAPDLRVRIADAVHRVIDTGLDGPAWQLCSLYAHLGAAVAIATTGHRDYYVNAGALYWVPDPADPTYWIGMDGREGGLARGEHHAWFGRPLSGGRAELVDLTTRHLPTYTHGLGSIAGALQAGHLAPTPGLLAVAADEKPQEEVRWARPECPDYVWTVMPRATLWRPHDWLRYIPDQGATEALWATGLPVLGDDGSRSDSSRQAAFRRLVERALLLVRQPDVVLIGPRWAGGAAQFVSG